MNWYYLDTQQKQIGPISDVEIQNLISKGTLKKETMVWNESMTGWMTIAQTPLVTFLPSATPPSLPLPAAAANPIPRPSAGFSTSAPDPSVAFGRDERLVYPTNPPRSPHMSWLNLVGPGLAQIVFGKTWMGISTVVIFTFLGYIDTFLGAINSEFLRKDVDPGFLAVIQLLNSLLLLGLLAASIVDAYMTGNRLREGQAVGKWQAFPRKNR